jgi:hypothetical protein
MNQTKYFGILSKNICELKLKKKKKKKKIGPRPCKAFPVLFLCCVFPGVSTKEQCAGWQMPQICTAETDGATV